MTAAWTPPLFGNGLDRGALWNAFVALAGQEIALPETGTALRFERAQPPAGDEAALSVSVAGQGTPMIACLRAFPFKALFGVDLDVADIPALPDGLRQAIREGLVAFLGSLLPDDVRRRLSVVAEAPASQLAVAGEIEWLALNLSRPDGVATELLVGWPRAPIVAELGRAVLSDAPRSFPLAPYLSLPADVTLGAITLTLAEMRCFEPGAIVVLAERGEEGLSIRVGEVLFGFVEAGGGWQCLGPRSLGRHRPRATLHRNGPDRNDLHQNEPDQERPSSMTDDTAAPDSPEQDAAAGFDLGNLTIAVDFDLGRSMLPLSTVASWKAGQVVEIASPSAAEGVEVTIRANGDIVGQGDLVKIDDRIAVRITRILARS